MYTIVKTEPGGVIESEVSAWDQSTRIKLRVQRDSQVFQYFSEPEARGIVYPCGLLIIDINEPTVSATGIPQVHLKALRSISCSAQVFGIARDPPSIKV